MGSAVEDAGVHGEVMHTFKSMRLLDKEPSWAGTLNRLRQGIEREDVEYQKINWTTVREMCLDLATNSRDGRERIAAGALLQKQNMDYINAMIELQKAQRLDAGESTENINAVVKYVDAPRDALL